MPKLLIIAVVALSLTACTTTQRNTAVGAGAGALVGGVATGSAGGALVGAGVGGVAGYALSQ